MNLLVQVRLIDDVEKKKKNLYKKNSEYACSRDSWVHLWAPSLIPLDMKFTNFWMLLKISPDGATPLHCS